MLVRTLAVAAALAGLILAASPVRACDSNYAWLCKPVPSIEPAEAATEAKSAKPSPVSSRRAARAQARAAKAAARAARAEARMERAAKARSRHGGRPARQIVLREPAAKAANPPEADFEESESRPAPMAKIANPPLPKPNAFRMTEVAPESNVGFATLWGERSTGTAAPVEAPVKVVSEPVAPAPAPVVPVATQNQVNEPDLAAAKTGAPGDGSWLRNLFIAFGGLLAVGSALRLFI